MTQDEKVSKSTVVAVLAWIHAVSHGLCNFQIHTRLHGLMVSAESCVAYARAWIHAFSHGLRDPGYRDERNPIECGECAVRVAGHTETGMLFDRRVKRELASRDGGCPLCCLSSR